MLNVHRGDMMFIVNSKYVDNGVVDCKMIREEVLQEVKEDIEYLPSKPTLGIFTIGTDDASKVYVRNKVKTAQDLGIEVSHITLDETLTQQEVEKQMLMEMPMYDAVMLQLPIPDKFDKDKLINLIPPCKDVDGLTDYNMGKLVNGREDAIVPATAQGVYEIIKRVIGKNDLSGFNIAVVNRSQLIGKPLQALLTNNNGTVSLCHSKTHLHTQFDKADIIVTGVGKPRIFNCFNLFRKQLIIDCGINRDENGKLCGDVDSESVVQYNEEVFVTPVPGGVGLLTVACLMSNVVKCYELQR